MQKKRKKEKRRWREPCPAGMKKMRQVRRTFRSLYVHVFSEGSSGTSEIGFCLCGFRKPLHRIKLSETELDGRSAFLDSAATLSWEGCEYGQIFSQQNNGSVLQRLLHPGLTSSLKRKMLLSFVVGSPS
ncbi:hypothetical protein E2320_011768 [Naja naja]|nr:hypothetical protein E2320_011768 [Naja naja]